MKYCSTCGQPFSPDTPDRWPRVCASCGHAFFKNPLPVAVVLVPLESGGVLAVRRGIPPHIGQLALPGGFVDWGETWQQAAAREVWEETSLRIDPDKIQLLDLVSVEKSHLLIFAEAPPIPDFDPGHSNHEVQELVILHEPTTLAFEAHTDALSSYFQRK